MAECPLRGHPSQSGSNSACGIFDLYMSACSSHTAKTYCDWTEKLGCGQKCGKHSHWSGCASICRDIPTCDEPDKEYLGETLAQTFKPMGFNENTFRLPRS